MVMNTTQPVVECVPNFSEGRNPEVIEAIAAAIRSVEGAHLLHIDVSPAANRTVMTFAGSPAPVVEAAFRAIQKAAELIDMQAQEGVHPRVGATDVCPLVPLYNITMEEVVEWSERLGKRVGAELGIPVYLYEHSAAKEHRKALPDIRKGQYEGFAEKMRLPDWAPDFGPVTFTPAPGVTIIGAREILVAFNIGLNTADITKASYIAGRIRERGYTTVQEGKRVKIPGLLQKTRAIGWFMADYNAAQVSLNLVDYRVSSPLQAWETCEALAHEVGVQLTGSEVIGLIPETCLLEAGAYQYLKQDEAVPEDNNLLIHHAIVKLGLNQLKPFEPQEKVLEYALFKAGLLR